jgi:prolyl-tRNA synthetase
LKGVPLRIEIGSKELENKIIKTVRRDDFSKTEISSEGFEKEIQNILNEIQKSLFEKSLNLRNEETKETDSYEEFKELIDNGNIARAH